MGFCYGANFTLAKKCLPKDNGNAKESSGIFTGTDDRTNGSFHFIRFFFPMRCVASLAIIYIILLVLKNNLF